MSTNTAIEQLSFHSLLEKIYREAQCNDSLQKIRSKAWDHYLQIGLPTQTSEVFRYLRLRNLYSPSYILPKTREINRSDIQEHILPECKESVLVFINGYFQVSLSNTRALPRIVICPFQEAAKTYGAFLNNQWAKTLKEELDPFAILNAALYSEGLFVYLPPKSNIEIPLQILYLIDSQNDPTFISPRIQFFVGAQSQLEVVSTQAVLSGKDYFVNSTIDFSIEEDSHVRYYQSLFDQTPESWFFEAVRANLKRNSSFRSIALTNGNAGVRYDYRVNLCGENAEANLNGISMLNEKREAHTHVLMEHQAPNCRSMQLFKSVLNDTGRSSFEGKIYVHQQAQKTDAFQLNNNLLLSDYAQAYSKPNLEIFADDVKASHGATVGQLDGEQLFYFKARGFSNAQAKSLLVYGFCKEVIDMLSIDSLKNEIVNRAYNFLKPKL